MRSTRAKPCPITPREVLGRCSCFLMGWLGEDPLTLSLSPRGERTPKRLSSTGQQPPPSPLGERAGVRGSSTIFKTKAKL